MHSTLCMPSSLRIDPFDETTHIWPRKHCATKQLQLMMSQVVQWTWFHKGCFGSAFQVIGSSFPYSAFNTAVSCVKLLIFE